MNRLRIINLYEADYNLILQNFWPQKVNHLAKESKTLEGDTWGTRPNCSTEHTTLEEIITKLQRLTCTSLCKFQDDAVVRFDRIVPTHAMLYSRKFEIPSSVCNITCKQLK